MAVNKEKPLGSETSLGSGPGTPHLGTPCYETPPNNAAGEQIEGEYTPLDVQWSQRGRGHYPAWYRHPPPGTKRSYPVRRWQLGHTRSADND